MAGKVEQYDGTAPQALPVRPLQPRTEEKRDEEGNDAFEEKDATEDEPEGFPPKKGEEEDDEEDKDEDEEEDEDKPEEEERNGWDVSERGATASKTPHFLSKRPSRDPRGDTFEEEDPDQISCCPHCHLALPLPTLRWHQVTAFIM